jgi:hypothetical protein
MMLHTLAKCVQALPDSLPGKTRLGARLLNLFDGPAALKDRHGCLLACISHISNRSARQNGLILSEGMALRGATCAVEVQIS